MNPTRVPPAAGSSTLAVRGRVSAALQGQHLKAPPPARYPPPPQLPPPCPPPQDFLTIPCDVLVPAALGGVINARTAPKLQCKVRPRHTAPHRAPGSARPRTAATPLCSGSAPARVNIEASGAGAPQTQAAPLGTYPLSITRAPDAPNDARRCASKMYKQRPEPRPPPPRQSQISNRRLLLRRPTRPPRLRATPSCARAASPCCQTSTQTAAASWCLSSSG